MTGTLGRTLAALFVVQFLAWGAMFALWVYTAPLMLARLAPGVGFDQPAAAPALTWVGACLATYALVGAGLNFAQAALVRRMGRTAVYAASLALAAAGIAVVAQAERAPVFLGGFVLVGLGWSAIGSLPYAIVAEAAPAGGEARALNILGFSIVVPQATAALALGPLARAGVSPAGVIATGAAAMLAAALVVLITGLGRQAASLRST